MQNSRLRIGFLLLLGLVSIVFLSLVCLFLFSLFYAVEGNASDSKTYVTQEFDPLTNTTSETFNKLYMKEIRSREYIGFFSNSGKYVSITPLYSSVMNSEFSCEANCICLDQGSNNRRSSSVLLNSLYYLVSASSLSFAIFYANNYFHDSCEKSYSSVCSKIDVGDSNCEQSKSGFKESVVEGEEEEVYDNNGIFECTGKCINIEEYTSNNEQELFTQELLTHNNVVYEDFKKRKDELFEKCKDVTVKEKVHSDNYDEAEYKFLYQHFIKICNDIGHLGIKDKKYVSFQTVCFPQMESMKCTRIK